jgi:F-type H+-transporting ATPase subunit epsilon
MTTPAPSLVLQVRIVSLTEEIYSGTALQVSAPALLGEVGILPRHAPLLTRLRAGTVRVRTAGGGQELICVSGGMLEVQPFEVTILADVATRAASTDKAAADEARRLTEDAAAQSERFTDRDYAYAELVASIAEINVLKKLYQKARRW